ncbi:hypothetical protein [Sulfobacillus thermosulfidooxidans]|uniref:hypothetical protein n=1 Tax=Sulfobacillus thermosulfidooxidans TaxID=28034 RepID=UPI0006B52171|nr:hypothetical protein [Sulfobacillus thermosulfidooxidans]
MNGEELSVLSRTSSLRGPFVVGGTRAYLIGDMDGTFPALGEHIPREMAGLWRHPNKLLQNIWLGWAYSGADPLWITSDGFHRGPWFVDQHFTLTNTLEIMRRLWIPDDEPGLMMELTIFNRGNKDERLELIMGFLSDLHPGWLDNQPRGYDQVYETQHQVIFQNTSSSWWVQCLSNPPGRIVVNDTALPPKVFPECATASIHHDLIVPCGETRSLLYWIVGGDGQPTVASFPENHHAWWNIKSDRYRQIDALSQVALPDAQLMHAMQWTKYQTDWLMREVSDIGRGLGAGMPEYPWWFACDSHYALKGVLTFGQHEWAKDTLALLKNVSQDCNGDGRIIHEVSTTGVVFNPGNMQEAPQFCDAVWETFLWSGDETWLRKMYPAVAQAMAWVTQADSSGRDLAPGYGIIEIEDLNLRMIDTAVYTYKGLMAYAQMAHILEGPAKAHPILKRAKQLKYRILTNYWIPEEGLFGDFLAFSSDIDQRVNTWMKRAKFRGNFRAMSHYRHIKHYKRPGGEDVYLMKNWIINTPMETGMAPNSWAQRALRRMRTSEEFHGPYGLYLSGIDRDEMMTISTGVQAVAEIQYGNADDALQWIQEIAKTIDIRSPGTISEMSPDYGCFVQAWTAYGLWYPVVTGFFGIHPNAAASSIYFEPFMPSQWNQASLFKIRIGTNFLDCEFTRSSNNEIYRIVTTQPWTVTLGQGLEVINADGARYNAHRIYLTKAGASVMVRKSRPDR